MVINLKIIIQINTMVINFFPMCSFSFIFHKYMIAYVSLSVNDLLINHKLILFPWIIDIIIFFIQIHLMDFNFHFMCPFLSYIRIRMLFYCFDYHEVFYCKLYFYVVENSFLSKLSH